MRALLAVLAALLLLGGCASQQLKFDRLEKRDRMRYAACRHDVVRAVCPDDPDCDVKAAEMFAAEPPDSRRRWLIDYHCPPDKIDYVDKKLRDDERKAIGM